MDNPIEGDNAIPVFDQLLWSTIKLSVLSHSTRLLRVRHEPTGEDVTLVAMYRENEDSIDYYPVARLLTKEELNDYVAPGVMEVLKGSISITVKVDEVDGSLEEKGEGNG
jgi:hypothetical protein